jgi:hypothetical protein
MSVTLQSMVTAVSESNSACAHTSDGHVALRHSKDPDGSVLIYTPREWDAFLKGVKDGEFDLP